MIRVSMRPGLLGALVLLTSGLCHAQEADDTDAVESELDEADDTEEARWSVSNEPTPEPRKRGRREGLEGKGYLAMEGGLFASYTADIKTTNALGAPTTVRYSASNVGLASPSWGIGFGYAASNHFVIGARLGLESAEVDVGGNKQKASSVGFAPQIKFVVVKEAPVLPYLSATVGYKKLTSEVNGVSAGGIDGVMYGGGLGLMVFPNPFFSIEPSANLLWNTLQDIGGSTEKATSMGVYITLTLSGWFGGSSGRAHAPSDADEDESYSEEVAPTSTAPSDELQITVIDAPNELNLKVDPGDRQAQFSVKLITPVHESAECNSLSIASDEFTAKVPAASNVQYAERQQQRVIFAKVPYQALRATIAESKSVWTACDATWELSGAHRRRLLDFLQYVRENARSMNTLAAIRAVPLPEGATLTKDAPAIPAEEPIGDTPSAVSPESE